MHCEIRVIQIFLSMYNDSEWAAGVSGLVRRKKRPYGSIQKFPIWADIFSIFTNWTLT